jgi:outer membrane protein OmpA-like peptidoglycan-associated protein
MKIRLSCLVIAAGAVLAGCASAPPQPSPVQTAPVATPAPATPTVSLEAEQRRLAELFKGTPVVWQLTPEGALKVDVPAKFCFDKGTAVVKPPLAKVLDYVAPSAKAAGMKAKVYAPADPHGATAVAHDRAASTRDYLVSKGVPVTHIAGLTPTSDDHVEIIVGRL